MKNLFAGKTKEDRNFLEKLTIAYAPHDEIIRKAWLETRMDASFEGSPVNYDREEKPTITLTHLVKHLGSI